MEVAFTLATVLRLALCTAFCTACTCFVASTAGSLQSNAAGGYIMAAAVQYIDHNSAHRHASDLGLVYSYSTRVAAQNVCSHIRDYDGG